MNRGKSVKTVAAGVMAFSLALGGGILATGPASAAAGTSKVQVQKATLQQDNKLEGLGRFEKQLLTLLKLDAAALKEKLQTQTLAEIAAEQGITKEALKAKIVSWIAAEQKAQLAKEKEKQKQAEKKKQQELAKQLKNKKLSPKAKQKLEQQFKQEQEQQKKQIQKKEQALKLEAATTADKLMAFTTESKVDSSVQDAPITELQHADEIAKLLNITTDQLCAGLKAGKTLAELAGEYKVEAQAVIDLFIAADVKELDAKLAAGEITQEEYDAQKAAKTEAAAQLVNTKFPGVIEGIEDVEGSGKFGALAKLLGMTESELKAAMKSGKSLADIAESHKVTAQQVVDLLIKDRLAKLDKKLAAREITKEEYDKFKKSLTEYVTAQVKRVPSAKGSKPEDGSKGHGWNFNNSQSSMSQGKNK
ncbi:SHOCT domain-containing protein [Paenibacillus sp. YPG26]|uniref:SHOCT domain-containing protein n=1 Tax=Paenibacillus sp. YPG26 TaxID=2878915 RepID=UPI00203C3FA4|nr:SHOCT domain-containing protein [Paenibacillus sp. YPG26]USB32824.1 SHOCT domain-containing protein [Paenibacillus sp. YPG26]